ncbi:MAG: hypothetical protein KME11_04755 [Timaviella obliquedivisa GSE-PSE-MK23-08B]|jgi:hypothetical protein|nr:hypothetical protein [Timaviella obliquedivisa GSE-PSE-MK23-08B]
MKKRITGEQIGLIAACLVGLIFLANTFVQASSTRSSTSDFADRSRQGLLKYLKDSCDGGNPKSCEKYKQQGGQ